MKPRLPHKQHGIPVSASGTNGPGKDIPRQARGTFGRTDGLRPQTAWEICDRIPERASPTKYVGPAAGRTVCESSSPLGASVISSG